LALAVIFAAAPAAADAQSCIAQNDDAYRLRSEGRLLAAREKLAACASADCPQIIAKECSRLLDTVTRDIPSVVLRVRNSRGADATNFELTVDGRPSDAARRGLPLSLDPGPHRFRVRFANGAELEHEVVLVVGEQRREVVLDAPRSNEAEDSTDRATSSTPWTFYALAGTGVVALGSFTLFALRGRDKENDLETGCAPLCAQDDIDAMRRDYLIADISLGLGILALGAAGFVLMDAQDEAGHGARIRLSARQLELSGAF
jgi:hypothetical protein